MSIHIHEHVYLEDIDTQLGVVFIANTSNESSNESAHVCSLTRAFATGIQNINTCICFCEIIMSEFNALECTYMQQM